MSAVTSVDCPLCGAKKWMMEDYFWKSEQVFYHCHQCGYGNLFEAVEEDGEVYFVWDKRYERRKFGKFVTVREKHGLRFHGPAFFYPIEAVFEGYYSVYPRSKKGKLVWKLYSADKKLLGDFQSLGEAFEVGDKHVGWEE